MAALAPDDLEPGMLVTVTFNTWFDHLVLTARLYEYGGMGTRLCIPAPPEFRPDEERKRFLIRVRSGSYPFWVHKVELAEPDDSDFFEEI